MQAACFHWLETLSSAAMPSQFGADLAEQVDGFGTVESVLGALDAITWPTVTVRPYFL
jgi:hypothetical protein